MLFITFTHMIEEQFLLCSSLEHWDRAGHRGCLGCAGGVVVMLSRQSQWPHSPWPDMWTPALLTGRHQIEIRNRVIRLKFTPLVLHQSKPNKDDIFMQDVYT